MTPRDLNMAVLEAMGPEEVDVTDTTDLRDLLARQVDRRGPRYPAIAVSPAELRDLQMADGTTIHLAYGRRSKKLRKNANTPPVSWLAWMRWRGTSPRRAVAAEQERTAAAATCAIERRDRRLVVGSRFYETHLEVLR